MGRFGAKKNGPRKRVPVDRGVPVGRSVPTRYFSAVRSAPWLMWNTCPSITSAGTLLTPARSASGRRPVRHVFEASGQVGTGGDAAGLVHPRPPLDGLVNSRRSYAGDRQVVPETGLPLGYSQAGFVQVVQPGSGEQRRGHPQRHVHPQSRDLGPLLNRAQRREGMADAIIDEIINLVFQSPFEAKWVYAIDRIRTRRTRRD